MTPKNTSYVTRKLVLKYAMENINIRKRTINLQELSSKGKSNNVWKQALNLIFDTRISKKTEASFSKN